MKILFIAVAALALCGCTVVSQNRTFPKLVWYWSEDAKRERQARAEHAEFERRSKTNNIAR